MNIVVTFEKLVYALIQLKFEQMAYGGNHSIYRHKGKNAILVLQNLRKNERVPLPILSNVKRTLLMKNIATEKKFEEIIQNFNQS